MDPLVVFAGPVGSLFIRPIGFDLLLFGRCPSEGHYPVRFAHFVADLVSKLVHVGRLVALVAVTPNPAPLGAKFDFLQSPRPNSSSHRHNVTEAPRQFSPQSSILCHGCGLVKVNADVHGHIHKHTAVCAQVELHFGC